MDKQNIVVTYNASPEQKALLLEVLGSLATLTFLNEIQSAQREQTLERADVLLSWNFPREILPHEYPRLQHVKFIQLISAGADHMPFAELPSHIIVASNPGAYATPMAEHVMAMTLALAKRLLIEHQKLRNGEFDQLTPNRMLSGTMAGIHAWWTEPFLHGTFRLDYPFLELPNVLGSPHNSAVVSNIILEAARQAAENVKHFLEGEKVIGIVRREDYLW